MHLFEPWNNKKVSKQRGQVWEQISQSLNETDTPKFTVSQKSVRDRYNYLEKEQKQRIKEEEKGSGISSDHTEFDESMRKTGLTVPSTNPKQFCNAPLF